MQHYAYILNFFPIQFYKSSKTNNGQVDGACAIVQVNVRERKCKCCQSTLSGPTRGTWALTFSGFGENYTKWLISCQTSHFSVTSFKKNTLLQICEIFLSAINIHIYINIYR